MIIKCPECGHQVSDKAPACPSCGVEIAGHVVKCPYCGEIYLKEDEVCPNCHRTINQAHGTETTTEKPQKPERAFHETEDDVPQGEIIVTPEEEITPVVGDPIEEDAPGSDTIVGQPLGQSSRGETLTRNNGKAENEKKNKHVALLVSFAIATITCFVLIYFYQNGKSNNEQEEFAAAMQSNNPNILQQYITEYKQSAPIEHIREAEQMLETLQIKADDWANVLKENKRATYLAYLNANPSTPHKQFITNKLDSIDWATACAANTQDAYVTYLDQHKDGQHHEEAGKKVQQMMTAEEKQLEADAEKHTEPVRRLLIGMNTKSTTAIEESVAEKLTFNGNGGSTATDVVQYMRDKLYQADVKNINWHMEKPTGCEKMENEDGEAPSYKLTIPAKLEINREGGKATLTYSIQATVNGQNRITSISLNRQ